MAETLKMALGMQMDVGCCCCCFSSRAALPAGRRSETVDLRPPVSQWLLMAPVAADQGRDDAVVLQLRRCGEMVMKLTQPPDEGAAGVGPRRPPSGRQLGPVW